MRAQVRAANANQQTLLLFFHALNCVLAVATPGTGKPVRGRLSPSMGSAPLYDMAPTQAEEA